MIQSKKNKQVLKSQYDWAKMLYDQQVWVLSDGSTVHRSRSRVPNRRTMDSQVEGMSRTLRVYQKPVDRMNNVVWRGVSRKKVK